MEKEDLITIALKERLEQLGLNVMYVHRNRQEEEVSRWFTIGSLEEFSAVIDSPFDVGLARSMGGKLMLRFRRATEDQQEQITNLLIDDSILIRLF